MSTQPDLVELKKIQQECKELVKESGQKVEDLIGKIFFTFLEIFQGRPSKVLKNYVSRARSDLTKLTKINLFNLKGMDEQIFTYEKKRDHYYYLLNLQPKEKFANKVKSAIDKLQYLKLLIKYNVSDESKDLSFLFVYFTNTVGFRSGIFNIDYELNRRATLEIFPKSFGGVEHRGYKFESLESYPPYVSIKEESLYIQFYEVAIEQNEPLTDDERKAFSNRQISLNFSIKSRNNFRESEFITCAYSSETRISDGLVAGLAVIQPLKDSDDDEKLKTYLIKQKSGEEDNNFLMYNKKYQIPFVKHFLRHKRITTQLQGVKALELKNNNIYKEFKEIEKISGLYVGFTIRSWAGNYKSIDRFLVRINDSGKITLYVSDMAETMRYGYVSSISSTYIVFKFSDTLQETLESRFSLTLIVDPTTLSFGMYRMIGVMSGLESSISQPSSGKVVLVKVDAKVKTQTQFNIFKIDQNKDYEILKPSSISLAKGIKSELDALYKGVFEKYVSEYIKEDEENKFAYRPPETEKWLSDFFHPKNEFDLSDTSVLVKKWLSNPEQKELDGKLFFIYTPSVDFHDSSIELEKLSIYQYCGYFHDDALTIKIDNKKIIKCTYSFRNENLVFSGTDQGNNLISGIFDITDRKATPNVGIVALQFQNKETFFSSKSVLVFDDNTESLGKEIYKKAFQLETKKYYPFTQPKEESVLPDNILSLLIGKLNRLIVLPSRKEGHRISEIFRYESNRRVWFLAALQSAQTNNTKEMMEYLAQAKLHGFPFDGKESAEIRKYVKDELYQSFTIEKISKIWSDAEF